MVRSLLLFPILLVGFATAPTLHTFPNLGFNVIRLDGNDLRRVCKPKTTDSGDIWMRDMTAKGCYSHKDNTIYIDYYYESIDLLLHELCHKDGSRTRLECKEEFP